MPPRRYVVNRSDMDAAKQLRERFYDREVERTIPITWKWPRALLYVGQNEAVQYTSDKWKKKGDFQDYKHVAEGPQQLYVKPGFLMEYGSRSKLAIPSERTEIPADMPEAIAELAPILGIQFQALGRDLKLSGLYYNVCVARAYIGAAQMPGGETFLIVYTRSDLCAIITGDVLGVEKDGIVG